MDDASAEAEKKVSHQAQVKWLDEQVIAEPLWWSGVLMRIAEGGESNTLEAIKDEYGLFWGPLRTWIGGDAIREREYQTALAYRAEGSQLKATSAVMRVVEKVHDACDVEVGHSLRGAELVLGSKTVHEHRFDADRQSEEQILATARALIEGTPGLLEQLVALVGKDAVPAALTNTYTRGATPREKNITPAGASTEGNEHG